MPELIRLQTPDFEFSVWANDITQRAKVYHTTVAKRASLTPSFQHDAARSANSTDHADVAASAPLASQPSYLLRFAPKAELVDITIAPSVSNKQSSLEQDNSLEQTTASTPEDLGADTAGPEKHAELTLSSPLFFENTQYQFEWVFFGGVADARLTHRSQSVNEAFRFAPEMNTARGVVPARLTGSINTSNDVGWLRLPLTFELDGKTHTQHIAFEVLPTKMALHQDLPAMYQAIDAVYPL